MQNVMKMATLGGVLLSGLMGATSVLAAEEEQAGVCDGLQGTAKGVYGLCVSICEAPSNDGCSLQFDADGVIIGEEAYANCKGPTRKQVQMFQDRAAKVDDSITLPCGDYQEVAVCPCGDVAEVVAEQQNAHFSSTLYYYGPVTGLHAFQDGRLAEFRVDTAEGTCTTTYSDGLQGEVATRGLVGVRVDTLPVSDEEAEACLSVINEAALQLDILTGGTND